MQKLTTASASGFRRLFFKTAVSGAAAALLLSLGIPPTLAQNKPALDPASYTGADREQRLVEGARKEGALTIYTSLQPEDTTVLATAFEKKYGIKVKVWNGNSEKVLAKTVLDAREERFEVDIIETNGVELEALHRQKLLRKVESPYFADLIPQAIMPHREWIGTRLNVFTLAYNSKLVKKADLPKTYQDLLNPKWKYKLGIETEDSDWFASVVSGLGEEKGLQLFRDIVAVNGMSVRKGHTVLANLVASGEVPLALTVYNYRIEQLKSRGASMNWFVIPPAIARANGIALARRAPNPHAAVLFLDFMITDAQQIMSYRDFVPTSTKVISRLNKFPIKFVDPKVVLDENEKWDRLYDDIFIKSAKKK